MEKYTIYTEQDEFNSNIRIIEIIPILFLIFGMYLYIDVFNIFTPTSNHKMNINHSMINDFSIPSILPLESGTFTIKSGYGYRRDPFSGRRELHEGLDFAAKRGTPIYATANGTVSVSKWKRGYGRTIEIDHHNGYKTMYGHLDQRLVKKNKHVQIGDIIGKVGSSGKATGNHLHYEVKYNDKNVDPKKYY